MSVEKLKAEQKQNRSLKIYESTHANKHKKSNFSVVVDLNDVISIENLEIIELFLATRNVIVITIN